MTGYMENLHALLGVTFRLASQPDSRLDFVIDTGFTGELTLPPAAVAAMHLTYSFNQIITLADETDVEIPVYDATVLWHGNERSVRVLATGRRPLLGTALLAGSEFLAQFAESGLVTLDEL